MAAVQPLQFPQVRFYKEYSRLAQSQSYHRHSCRPFPILLSSSSLIILSSFLFIVLLGSLYSSLYANTPLNFEVPAAPAIEAIEDIMSDSMRLAWTEVKGQYLLP